MNNHYSLSLAAWIDSTYALGPGKRFAFWLQGCPFSCPGCVAPSFLPIMPAHQFTIEQLLSLIAPVEGCEGITISGGEPMLQAEPLAALLKMIHSQFDLSVIIYSGYYLNELKRLAVHNPAISQILGMVDVLIDGRYEHSQNDSRGLRGSANQTIHFFTKRYAHLRYLFVSQQRMPEIHPLPAGNKLMVGLPTLSQWRYTALDSHGQKWYDDLIS
ncbi:MAG: 4Fe-4S single cluster domain-containing protein [Pseudomonadota bacterium]